MKVNLLAASWVATCHVNVSGNISEDSQQQVIQGAGGYFGAPCIRVELAPKSRCCIIVREHQNHGEGTIEPNSTIRVRVLGAITSIESMDWRKTKVYSHGIEHTYISPSADKIQYNVHTEQWFDIDGDQEIEVVGI
jgi:hypothetical protein